MTLVSAGDPLQERYTFSFEMDKSVVPAVELIPGLKEMTVCWFNGTRVTAALWTRRRALYNPSNSSLIGAGAGVGGGSTNGGAQGLGYGAGGQGGPAGSNQFAPWPYAAELQQVRAAGPGVPDCRGQDVQGVPGARKEWPVDLEVEGGGSDKECACEYANYGEGMALPTPPSAAPPLPAPASGSSTSNSASTNMPLTTTAPPAESTRASGAGQGTGPGTGAGTGAGTGGRGGMTSTMPPAAMTPTAASMVADR